jgi:hypothetical protein
MTFPLLDAFEAEWKLRPPVHWLVAGFVGYKPPQPKVYMNADAARQWMRLTGGKIPGVQPFGISGRSG